MEQEKKRKFPIIWVGALDLEALSKLDPPQPSGVKITGDGYVAIDWGGYEYLIENERIATPERLLGWIVHIGQKGWGTPHQISALVEVISRRNKWKIWCEPM